MTHVVLGYPNIEKSRRIVQTLVDGGADYLEFQIPFSDPIADGSTIMMASEIALKNGMNTDTAFQLIESLTFHTLPTYIMCYYNQVFRYGVERFISRAKEVGVVGLIVPDMPPEEEKNEGFFALCKRYDLDSIRVVSPSSTHERVKINSKIGKGFLYCVSHFGVTGAKSIFDTNFYSYISRLKQQTTLPLAVGFGISKKEQIEALNGSVDIAIIGSALINEYKSNGLRGLQRFIRYLKAGTIQP